MWFLESNFCVFDWQELIVDKQVLGYKENLIMNLMEEFVWICKISDNAIEATTFWSILRYHLNRDVIGFLKKVTL